MELDPTDAKRRTNYAVFLRERVGDAAGARAEAEAAVGIDPLGF